jgi:archaellum component FlaC
MENSFENIPVIPQPKELKINLYLHQRASVYEMETRERTKQVKLELEDNVTYDTNIGVNADITGYGKTLSMVTLIYRDKMEWDLKTPFVETTVTTFASGKIKKTIYHEYNKIDVTLILANNSIIKQWYDELMKTPLCVTMVTTKKSINNTIIDNYDVILVTPTMYNDLVNKYYGFAWKRFIYDEPGHMRVPGMTKIIAGFIWFVTATPDAIISKHKGCRRSFMYDIVSSVGWATFSYYFKYLIVKNNELFIKHSFSMPPTQHYYYKCYNPIYNTVKGFVTERITQMISAGNINGAIKALGGGTTNNITKLVRQKKMEELEELEARIKIYTIRNNKKKVEKLSEDLSRLEGQINELDNRYKNILSGDCNICLEKIKEPVMEPECQNVFCGSCLLTWLKSKPSCPLCRHKIDTKKLIYIDENNGDTEYKSSINVKELKTKVNTVISLIRNNSNGKFIIFSGWDQTFTPIRETLIKNDIEFIEVKGGTTCREKKIDNFRNGDINVIFLNSKNNGSGINLQETTDIIIYHEMSENMLNQIIGRANRIGRTKSLNVHHLQI